MIPRRVETVGYLLWHLSLKWRVAADRVLNRFGLTHAHYLLLASLLEFSRSGAKPSQRQLSDFAGLDVVYVSKLACTLERCGLLQRADHPGDTRAFQLELTARGGEVVVQAAAAMRELYDQLLTPIGGRTGKRHAALTKTLGMLLDEAQAFNRTTWTQVHDASRPGRPSRMRS